MGFGSIIATGLTVILLIVTGYLIMAGLISSVNSAEAASGVVRDAREAQIDTSLDVWNVTKAGGSSLQFSVNNTGCAPIGNISQLDVIVRFVDADNGSPVSGLWMPWAPASASDCWHAGQIVSMARDAAISERLNSGEMLVIRCDFDGLLPSNAGSITVSTANGECASGLFNFDKA